MPSTPDGLWYSRAEAMNALRSYYADPLIVQYIDLYSLVDAGLIGSTGVGFARMRFLRADVDRIAATRREGA